jgi:hypothetical protein
MWIKFFNSKFFIGLFSAALSFICALITLNIAAKKVDSDNIKHEFTIRPTFEYVDKQDQNIMKYVDKQDGNVIYVLDEYIQQVSKLNEANQKMVESMDHKIDILLRQTK